MDGTLGGSSDDVDGSVRKREGSSSRSVQNGSCSDSEHPCAWPSEQAMHCIRKMYSTHRFQKFIPASLQYKSRYSFSSRGCATIDADLKVMPC